MTPQCQTMTRRAEQTRRVLVIGVLSCLTAMTSGIVIRHDRADVLYQQRAKGYDCLVTVGNAHGTLIAPNWILTAAHTVVGLNPLTTSMTIGGERYRIKRLVMHPSWAGGYPPGYAELEWVDMALIQLARPVDGLTPAGLYAWDNEVGQIATLVGTGTTGDGHTGPLERDGLLRAADNRVDRVDEHWLFFPFDEPPNALEFEGVSGKGDSGGPALLRRDGELFVAGVCSRNDDYGEGKDLYNTTDVYTRVSAQVGWIQRVMDGTDASGIPRPADIDAWPATPAGDAGRAFLEAINNDDPEAILTFETQWRLPKELRIMPAEKRAQMWRSLRKRGGHLTPVSIVETTAYRLYIVVQGSDRQRVIDIFTVREAGGALPTQAGTEGKVREIHVLRMPPPRKPGVSMGMLGEDSLASLRTDLESITSLSAIEFRVFETRLRDLLKASTSRGQRISIVSVGFRLADLGPEHNASNLRRLLLNELVVLAPESPRARMMLQSSFLPRLADFPESEHKTRAQRFDAEIAACLDHTDVPEIRADLEWLPLSLRVEMNRTMDSAWMTDDVRAATIDGVRRFADIWGDVASSPGATYHALAESALYELEHLPMGRELIDPILHDVDGSELRVSDYRGRVVVLTFWTTWCIPCMAAVPDEKAMCERLAGEPFTFLGVSSDPTPDQARSTATNRNMPWRNIWSPSTPDGSSFVSRLMVRGWPTLIVLDSTGHMRYRFGSPLRSSHGTATVEEAVRTLLNEMNAQKDVSP